MVSVLCRVCLTSVERKHSTALFTGQNWSHRLSELLRVPVREDDSFPDYICRSCRRTVESVESKLRYLKERIMDSYKRFSNEPNASRKRPKPTSSLQGISPATAAARPPSKRTTLHRRQLFPTANEDVSVCCVPLREVDASSQSLPAADTTDGVSDACQVGSAPPGGSPQRHTKSIMVTVTTPSRPSYNAVLGHELQQIGCALAGGNMVSIAKSVYACDALRDLLLKKVIATMDAELMELCKRNTPSIFRRLPIDAMSQFDWCDYIAELQLKAPTLLDIVTILVSRNDGRNKHKSGNVHYPGICTAIAIVLKERNREMCSVQTLLSLVMFTSRVQKQVYTRLNHACAALSYGATISAVEAISKQRTVPIRSWIKEGIEFKFVGDNVDKKRGVRDLRIGCHGEMKHMYSIIAVRSRIAPCSAAHSAHFSLESLQPSMVLPNVDDVCQIKKNLMVLVSRILCRYITCLSSFSGAVLSHIPHEYSDQMACKSDTIVLDVVSKNEAKHSDMIDIMNILHDYLGEGFPSDKKVLSGGDQLTCERQVCAQRHMMDGNSRRERLAFLEPVCEDWHCLMCFLGVVWKVLFSTSSRDHGTLGHFCALLGRLPQGKDPKKDFNACRDVLFTVLKGHYIAAACSELGIEKADRIPPNVEVLAQMQQQPVAEQRQFIYSIAQAVVEKCSIIGNSLLFQSVPETHDMVHNYARVLCHYGSLALEFVDAWEEGDGERICRCWKLFILHFYENGRTKYSWEALRLQLQLISLPSTLSKQLKWNRFVNTHGGLGRNIPCDLHNEHVNKLFKEVIANMGANLTDTAMQRTARAITTLHHIRTNFDKVSGVPVGTSAHSTRPDGTDVLRVTSVVHKEQILRVTPGRHHCSHMVPANPLAKLKKESLIAWIDKKIKLTAIYQRAQGEGNQSDSDASDGYEHT